MKLTKNLLASTIAATVITAGVAAPAMAEVEVSGSVGVANTYLWRGYDLGSGTPAVSGDLSVSAGGFYGGIWGSSGDTAAGSEYDLYAGYGGSAGDFTYDISVWSYNYPTGPGYTSDGETDLSDFTDVVVAVGFGPVAFTAYVPVGDDNSTGDYMYYTLGTSFGKYSITAGMHADNSLCPSDDDDGVCDSIHVNFDYAFNDNLTFTFSQFVVDGTDDDDLKFVVSYSLPIGD